MKKILIIDDDSRNIFALTATLKAKGYQCLSATTAEDGFDLLEKDNTIGMVLLDMMMPEMDGYEAISHIRNHNDYHGIPIIAVTAQAMVGDKEKCIEAGADDYIAKPINVDMLLEKIEQY